MLKGIKFMTKTILIVEDESHLRAMLSKKIGSSGFKTELARDGLEAIYKLRRKRIDLVLLDIITPRRSGIQVLHAVRIDLESSMPVVVLSNLDHEDVVAAGKAYGISAYIVKARASMEQIVDVITETLGPKVVSPLS